MVGEEAKVEPGAWRPLGRRGTPSLGAVRKWELLLIPMSCPVFSCLVLSCLVLSCLVSSCLVFSCHAWFSLVLSCCVLLCFVMLGLIMFYPVASFASFLSIPHPIKHFQVHCTKNHIGLHSTELRCITSLSNHCWVLYILQTVKSGAPGRVETKRGPWLGPVSPEVLL